jgi:hypothetical protein
MLYQEKSGNTGQYLCNRTYTKITLYLQSLTENDYNGFPKYANRLILTIIDVSKVSRLTVAKPLHDRFRFAADACGATQLAWFSGYFWNHDKHEISGASTKFFNHISFLLSKKIRIVKTSKNFFFALKWEFVLKSWKKSDAEATKYRLFWNVIFQIFWTGNGQFSFQMTKIALVDSVRPFDVCQQGQQMFVS